jgi:hypothetical protein
MAITKPMLNPMKLECIVSAWPRIRIELPRGNSFSACLIKRLDVMKHATQITTAHAAENIKHGPDVIVGNDLRTRGAFETGEIGE